MKFLVKLKTSIVVETPDSKKEMDEEDYYDLSNKDDLLEYVSDFIAVEDVVEDITMMDEADE